MHFMKLYSGQFLELYDDMNAKLTCKINSDRSEYQQ